MFQRIMTEIKKKSENNGQELINPDSHIFHNDVDHQKVLELNQRFKDKIEESKKAHQRLKELSKNF